jgi:type I restriction enzyme S subunit
VTRYRFDQIAENSTAKKKPEESDRNRYVGLEHLDPGTLEVTRWGAEVTPKGDKLLMKKGDVLFGRRRAYQKKVGIAPFDGIFSAHGMVLRPKADVVDPMFFPFFISSDIFLDEAIRVSVGSLSPTANWKDLRTLEFDLPSPGKQRELAGILSEAESLKGYYRKMLTTCDDVVKSQFVEMFDKPGIPIKHLEDIADIQGGITKNKKREAMKLQLPYLRVANILPNELDLTEVKTIGLTEQEYEAVRLISGDLLIVEGNGSDTQIGRSAIWDGQIDPCVHQNHLIRVRLRDEALPLYVQTFLSSSEGRRQIMAKAVNTSGLHTLSTGKIRSIEIPVPPFSLQREFADFATSIDKSKFTLGSADATP